MWCEYRHIFGVEGEGIHSYRILNLAVVDVALTILAGWFISWKWKKNIYVVWICLFFLGIILHRIFCVNTTLNKIIFNNDEIKV